MPYTAKLDVVSGACEPSTGEVEAEVEVIAALSHKNQEFPAHNRSLERKEDFSLGYLLVGWPSQYLEFRSCLLE